MKQEETLKQTNKTKKLRFCLSCLFQENFPQGDFFFFLLRKYLNGSTDYEKEARSPCVSLDGKAGGRLSTVLKWQEFGAPLLLAQEKMKGEEELRSNLAADNVVFFAKSYPTLCIRMDCSPLVSSVHGILQARIQEWDAISFSRGSSQPRDPTHVICVASRFFTLRHKASLGCRLQDPAFLWSARKFCGLSRDKYLSRKRHS